MRDPIVDVIVAVHTSSRPIARAVSSVVDHTAAPVRVTVVAHNIDREIIRRNLGRYAEDDHVRLLHLQDGIASPSGPLNFGLAQASAPYLAVMGSDDEFEPGAIDSWLSLRERFGAEVIIARIRHTTGRVEASPAARPFRRHRLDAVKDRLAYRSAPLGLILRERFGDLRFAEGLRSGEDLPYVVRLWFSGARVAFDRSGPAYLVHDDEDDRVTFTPRSISEDFAFLTRIIDDPSFAGLSARQREALTVKLIRSHLFDAVLNRSGEHSWPQQERGEIAAVAHRLTRLASRPERLLSRLDQKLLDAILDPARPIEVAIELVHRRSNYATLSAILPSNPLYVLHRQAPLRTLAAGFLVQRS